MTSTPSFQELEGRQVIIVAPNAFPPKGFAEVLIRRAETGGVWIESQRLTDATLGAIGVGMAPKTLVFFLPWHQINYVVNGIDIPAIATGMGQSGKS